jgi:non-specific serine/threonine protein kinase/serine/threonine-protein kinase
MVEVDDQQRQRPPMAGRARDLALEQLEEMPAVVQAGQRVDRRELIDLLVVARLDRGTLHELQHAAADRNMVAVLEFGLDDRLVVEQGLVGRVEVLDPVTGRLLPDPRMLARHAAFHDLEFALGRATDDQRLAADIDALAEALPLQHDQTGRGRAALGIEIVLGADRAALRGAGVAVAVVHSGSVSGTARESMRMRPGLHRTPPSPTAGHESCPPTRARRICYIFTISHAVVTVSHGPHTAVRAQGISMHTSDFPADDATEFQSAPKDAAAGATLEAGSQLGPYVIRRVLGEGGMGCVYLAEQQRPVRREVALKLIREQVASPLARAYFDVERQALAQMQHPAIAQVFDAGTTEQGHPYLAMEVVEGSPITRFCRDEKLRQGARLALFARVCHGVQHAHQKGIIHRDLKPANVLVRRVDGEPSPKIIDFGIAIGGNADGSAVQTAATDRAGTAVYMSPEQSGRRYRDLDTRSDVYSLGVMLYEVLTDADAAALTSIVHDSARAPHETLLAAIDSDALSSDASPAPDALLLAARRLPSELRAILRKALAPDRADRYDSAAALADDLERYVEQRPVKALPQTRWYLARTFIARHRLGLAAASLAALALLAGTVLALHGLAQARVEAAKSVQVSEFVRGILGGIDPDRAKGMDTKLMRMVLDSAAERAGRELAGQPDVRAEIEYTIAGSYASLGERAIAGTHYEAALAAARKAGKTPAELARIAMRIAQNLDNQGKAQEAVVAAAKVFASVESLPTDDRDRLFIESALAGIETDAGQLDSSRARFERVLERQRATLGDDHPETLESLEGLAIANSNMSRFDESRALYTELIERRRRLHGEEHSETLGAINGLAVLELEQKHFAAAEKLLAPMMPFYERVYGPEHPTTLRVVNNLGGAIRQQGRNEEARPYYERALALSTQLFGPNTPAVAVAETNLALLLRDAGELDEAERHARIGAEAADIGFGSNPIRAIMHREYGTVLTRLGRYTEAEKELDIAWGIFTADPAYGSGHTRAQDVVEAYVELYEAWGKPDRVETWRGRKIALSESTAGR